MQRREDRFNQIQEKSSKNEADKTKTNSVAFSPQANYTD
jgi:hypothetical protein